MTSALRSTGIRAGRILTGLLGRGILESRTPWLQEQEAEAHGLRMVYSLFDFTDRGWRDEDLEEVVAAAQRLGFAGLNVTFPFKQAVIPLLDGLSEAAAGIRAVNTIVFVDGKRIGHNTDVTGFAAGFRLGFGGERPGRVLQLGCGGAGSATAHALLGLLGADRLVLYDPDPARLEGLRSQLAERYGADRLGVARDPVAAARDADGLLNASPVGMTKLPGMPIPAAAIESRHWVADIIYFPLETALLAEARRKGCRTLDGSGMAVHQAIDAFAIFTGRDPDHERMRASFFAYEMTPADALD
ncbi:shikimate dehydrogenase [Novosphingobium piscinae]|uniref:shikimate dehydrogenase n=1 Tax=Novosphingobium piscinae TaxID=1507448 RepID=UPI001FE501B4|nr:shikimate dehydrogenase [Novosphingobium piscinae]